MSAMSIRKDKLSTPETDAKSKIAAENESVKKQPDNPWAYKQRGINYFDAENVRQGYSRSDIHSVQKYGRSKRSGAEQDAIC